jgi:hypothetical protein
MYKNSFGEFKRISLELIWIMKNVSLLFNHKINKICTFLHFVKCTISNISISLKINLQNVFVDIKFR